MDPSVWGPPLWFVMQSIAMNYPETNPSYLQQRNHHDFYHSLRNVLPCTVCREHYTELLKLYPIGPSLGSRNDLVAWVVLIHNKVNARYDKAELSAADVAATYERIYTSGAFCPRETHDDAAAVSAEEEDHGRPSGGAAGGAPVGRGGATKTILTGKTPAQRGRTVLLVLCLILLVAVAGAAVLWKIRGGQ
jgi:hypothetical protein